MMYVVCCVGNGSDKPTSVLCCGYQHRLITRASIICKFIFPFIYCFLYADRKRSQLVFFVSDERSLN